MINDEYVSVDDAASEFDVSRGTVWRWVRLHDLPTFRFFGERRTFLRRSDLARLREPIPVERAKKVAA